MRLLEDCNKTRKYIPPDRIFLRNSRIAFLGVDQVRNFEVQGEIGLIVGEIACLT